MIAPYPSFDRRGTVKVIGDFLRRLEVVLSRRSYLVPSFSVLGTAELEEILRLPTMFR